MGIVAENKRALQGDGKFVIPLSMCPSVQSRVACHCYPGRWLSITELY